MRPVEDPRDFNPLITFFLGVVLYFSFDLLIDFAEDFDLDLLLNPFVPFFRIFFMDELLVGLYFLMESLTDSNKTSSNFRLFLSFSEV